MKFEIEDFRRFHKPSQAEIAPITVLVGENSSGKTSFLAGFRYIIQSMSFGDEGSFNREPFFLGAYDQIAHYRGGRFGRSDHFTLGLHLNEGEVEQFLPDNGPIRYISYPFQGKKLEASHSVSKLYFSNDQSQPILQKVFLANKYVSINMKRDALPIFDITRIDNKDEIAISANEPVLYYAHASTIINRNSLGPYIQSIQNWMYTNRLTHQKRGKIDKKETEFLELVGKAVLPTYAFPDKAIYASAPFRTKPERTYSPVEASSSVEGSHIPILLAQAKAFERNKWSRIKETLESFGARSGMFRKIDIKRLGHSDSDPFQLIVTVSKDKSNIIDVGYGVSQILPLIVETLINEDATFFLFQQPEVHLHPRAQAELGSYFVDFAIRSKKFILIETHSDYIIDRIRRDLVNGNYDLDKHLSVLFFDKYEIETSVTRIKFDADGNVLNPPPNYREFFLSESIRNLGL